MEKMLLWDEKNQDSFLLYNQKSCDLIPRPAVLVVPGGGYGGVCMDTEGYPVAAKFAAMGFRAFILHYRVAPCRYPMPQQDILRAIKLIRAHADEWGVIVDNLAVCGFSAGGHLAASSGILFDEISADHGDLADRENARPDALLLAYPVITFGPSAHIGSGQCLLGDAFEAKCRELSLENRVQNTTPPTFIWHTVTDQIVPVENSFLFADALRRAGQKFDLHIFPSGPHGMQLGYGRDDIAMWPQQAKAFLQSSCAFRFPEKPEGKTVVLTFDDACKSHLTVAAPVLKRYGFGATFFITRFDDAWRNKHEDELLTGAEIKTLSEMGFEIGSHTWNHPYLGDMSEAECTEEVDRLHRFLADAGIHAPVTFAYPGGPYIESAVPVLKKTGLKLARTTEGRAWNPAVDSPWRIPAISLQKEYELDFYHAIGKCAVGNAVVLVFHGVPDTVHAHVNTPQPVFEKYMKYLYDNSYTVLSMAEYAKKCGQSL